VVAAPRHFATLKKQIVAASHARQQTAPLVFDHQVALQVVAQDHSD
jgi:hypothetical protein